MKKKISIVLVLVLGLVAEVAKADFIFDTPTKVPNVNSSSNEFYSSFSVDGLSLFFISNRPGGYGGYDIWVTMRETTDDPWGTPVNLGPTINTPVGEYGVSISSDGLSLYFDTRQSGTSGAIDDLWVATRATTDDDWGNPVSLGPTVNSSADECYPSISADGLDLYFTANRAGGYGNYDLWVTKRETVNDPWGAPLNLGPTVNSSTGDGQTSISADGRMLFFATDQSGGYGQMDIWVTRRATTDDPWGEPVNLGSTVNSSGWDEYPNVSADGSTLYFRTSQSGRWGNDGDIWQAPIIPIVDFNGDGIVNAADTCVIVDHWGENYSLCDIGPTPLGDGIVDVQDLIALSEHFFADIYDPTLAAHWAMDETEGVIVADSSGANTGYALGGPIWEPDGGQVGGAIRLDGIDDYIAAPPALNPADGPFSVFVWIKGGGAGQAVISEPGGATWLSIDPLDGFLMTELASGGRSTAPLLSETTIADGQWHRIGLVWDGSNRTLYVDGGAVAQDTQNGLADSSNGLNIGCGPSFEPNTFFSGMIDDIRIYNRAITP